MKALKTLKFSYLGLCLVAAACSSGPASNSINDADTKKTRTAKISGDDANKPKETEEVTDPAAEAAKDAGVVTPAAAATAAKRAADALTFFTDKVEPQFQISCARCHAEPRFNPSPVGPLSIFDYDLMKGFLKLGDGKINNKLMDKARAQIAHGGGSACGSDITGLPCSLIMEWWGLEYGADAGSTALAAELELVKFDGTVSGYAASVLDPAAVLNVDFYVGGDKATGTKLPAQPATRSGYAGGVQGNHRFQFVLPDIYRDAVEHQVYGYAIVGDQQIPLKGSPFKFKAWKPKGDAAFYKAKFVGCGCHSRTYVGDYSQLGTPSPNQGGTATNNKLYIMGAGGGHTGGGYDTAFVQAFWNAEFGP
jgi:hypothetical protein